MSSVKSPIITGEVTSVTSPGIVKKGDVVRTGNLKKLKSMRKRFFVLRSDSPDAFARLEYYDSEKKFLANNAPKRSITLKSCFNINRKTDVKSKFVIALYTRDEIFCIVLENEQECEAWLRSLLSLQHGQDLIDGEQLKPDFDYVWCVTIQDRGLGQQCNMIGPYHLCLSLRTRTVSLVRLKSDGDKDSKDFSFSLNHVRSCGAGQIYFYMEVGRQAVTGDGEIWMLADEQVASDINRILRSAMENGLRDDGQKNIIRSHSVSESNKPNSIPSRRQTHSGMPKSANNIDDRHISSRVPAHTDGITISNIDSYCEMQQTGGLTIEQADTCPMGTAPPKFLSVSHQQPSHFANILARSGQRRHSVSAVSVGAAHAHQKGSAPTPLSAQAHHHQRTYSFPLSPLPPSTTVRRGSTGAKCGIRPPAVVYTGSGGVGDGNAHAPLNIGLICGSSAGRERCDSLPSSTPRPGAVNDNAHYQHGPHHNMVRNIHHGYPVPGHGHGHGHTHSHAQRPHSMYSRAFSLSPPVASSPASPSSGACSTDSAGSSHSIDEGDGCGCCDGCLNDGLPGHSMLTPEEPIILEENADDYAHWNGPITHPDSSLIEDDKMNNYVPMDRSPASLTLPIQSLCISGTTNSRKLSGGSGVGGSGHIIHARSGSSPSHPSYMDMCSPCGSSPMDNSSGYMMSGFYSRSSGSHLTHTAPSSANHSRTSSLAEETPDGYVPMMPGLIDDGYNDMDRTHSDSHSEDLRHSEVSPSSQGSLASGTPSTDLRFSEYQTEKGDTSYFTPEEEDSGVVDRPQRCYSVGSKSDELRKKSRLEMLNQSDCRVRAFSVGSRNAPGSKLLASRPLAHDIRARCVPGGHYTPPSHHRIHQPSSNKKSSSAPLLSNSPKNRHLLSGSHSSVDPMDDLMEIDFSHNSINKNARKNAAKSRTKVPPAASPCELLPQTDRVLSGNNIHSSQSSAASSYSTASSFSANEGYMDMTPSRTSIVAGSPRTLSDFRCDTSIGSPPKVISSGSSIRNVIGIGRSPPESMARSPPGRTGSSPRSAVTRMSSITELKPQNFPSTTPSPPIKPNLLSTSASSRMKVGTSPYVDMAGSKPVEMKPRAVNASLAPTRGVPSPSGQEYVDMNLSKTKKMPTAAEGKENAAVVRRTAPVDTPMVRKPPDGYVEMSWNQSKPGRKWSIEGFRAMAKNKSEDYMNMSGDGSTKSRKDRRKKDNSCSSTGSAGSPIGSENDSLLMRSRKSSKDSTSSGGSSMTPTGSNSTIFPLSPGSPSKSFPPTSSEVSPSANPYVDMTLGKGSTSTTAPATGHDYVNFCPGTTPSRTEEPQRKLSAPAESTYSKLTFRSASNDLNLKKSVDSGYKSSLSPSVPLTISSLLGVNNFNTATPQPVTVTPSSTATVRPLQETKILNRLSEVVVPIVSPAGSGSTDKKAPSTPPVVTAPLATVSPSWSPSSSPSPIPAEQPSSGKGSPFKKLSSESDSSSTSRESQLPSPAGKGKNKTKCEVNRRLSCPNRMNISRHGSASSEASEVSNQSEDANSRGSVVSQRHSPATLDKRSLSCSPELLGNAAPSEAANITSAGGSISPVATVEKELNYASLDLRSGSESEDSATRSPRLAEANSANTSTNGPSDGNGPIGLSSQATFTYAEIDFVRSEELRRANSASGPTTDTSSVKRRV